MAIVNYATVGTITYTETAAITDLTGTKWIFNSELTISNGFYFDINFISNNTSYTRIQCYPDLRETGLRYDTDIVAQGLGESNGGPNINSWISEAYRTIEITGGTDATNADLIAWLQANATQQVEPEPTDKISIGASSISKIFVGNSEVSKIYLGDALVYEGVSIPDNALLTADNTYLVDNTGGYLLTTETALISFNVDSISYQAESGMTWQEWVNSEYNTNGYIVENDTVKTADLRDVVANGITSVLPSKPIIANTSYTYIATGGGADF